MSGAEEYWLVSFEDSRQAETRSSLESLITGCNAENAAFEKVEHWAMIPENLLKTIWVLSFITDELLAGQLGDDAYVLDAAIQNSLRNVVAQQIRPRVEFGEIAESSASTWDIYLKRLTPDLPSYLPDFISGRLQASAFHQLWWSLREKLSEEETRQLKSWYTQTAKKRARSDIDLTFLE